MPIHVDINVNTELVQRVHICRMDGLSMDPDSVNTYSVVVAEKRPVYHDDRGTTLQFTDHPTWLEWEGGVMFTHRYGDGATVCVMKGLQAYYDHLKGEQNEN